MKFSTVSGASMHRQLDLDRAAIGLEVDLRRHRRVRPARAAVVDVRRQRASAPAGSARRRRAAADRAASAASPRGRGTAQSLSASALCSTGVAAAGAVFRDRRRERRCARRGSIASRWPNGTPRPAPRAPLAASSSPIPSRRGDADDRIVRLQALEQHRGGAFGAFSFTSAASTERERPADRCRSASPQARQRVLCGQRAEHGRRARRARSSADRDRAPTGPSTKFSRSSAASDRARAGADGRGSDRPAGRAASSVTAGALHGGRRAPRPLRGAPADRSRRR